MVALEPSETMRRQRPRTLPPALIGVASSLPFDDRAFDAAMGIRCQLRLIVAKG